MAREKPTLREECLLIRDHFPDKGVLSMTDIMEYTGRSRPWCQKHGFRNNMSVSEAAFVLVNLK